MEEAKESQIACGSGIEFDETAKGYKRTNMYKGIDIVYSERVLKQENIL